MNDLVDAFIDYQGYCSKQKKSVCESNISGYCLVCLISKHITVTHIARLNREFLCAKLQD